MGLLAQQIQATWAAKTARSIEVPEWKMTLTVYPLTIGQLTKIQAESDPFRRAARIIETRSKNPEGLPLFDNSDFEALCFYGIEGYGPAVTARVAAEIMADLPVAEAVEKN